MPRRPHAPGCLLVVLSLVVPGVATAEPVLDDAAVDASSETAVPEAPGAEAPDSAEVEPDAAADPAQTDRGAAPASEPAQSEPPESEPAQSEPAQSEPAQSEPAQSDDAESESDESDADDADDAPPGSPLPDRLPRLQRIGWYHVIGAFTLGTTAGLLAGLAERQEDKATRIASGYNLETGGSVLYADRQQAYERTLDRGQALETSAIVMGALAGATAIAAITLFALDAKRRAPSATARRTRLGPGSLEVSF